MKRPVSPDNKREPRAKNQAKPSPLAVTVTMRAVSAAGAPLMHSPTPKTMSALAIQRRRKPPDQASPHLQSPLVLGVTLQLRALTRALLLLL